MWDYNHPWAGKSAQKNQPLCQGTALEAANFEHCENLWLAIKSRYPQVI